MSCAPADGVPGRARAARLLLAPGARRPAARGVPGPVLRRLRAAVRRLLGAAHAATRGAAVTDAPGRARGAIERWDDADPRPPRARRLRGPGAGPDRPPQARG